MMSLFSSFDISFSKFPMIIIFIVSMNLLSMVYKNGTLMLVISLKSMLESFFLSMKSKSFNKLMTLYLVTCFMLMMYLNLSSILSYNFALTTQLSTIMMLSLASWAAMMAFSIANSTKNFLSHCIPEGTPINLVWFLFLIELISNTIRPITVTVRLLANITAGHLLLTLLAKLVENFHPSIVGFILLNSVEMFVALIQSYIYATMLCLYYSEVK